MKKVPREVVARMVLQGPVEGPLGVVLCECRACGRACEHYVQVLPSWVWFYMCARCWRELVSSLPVDNSPAKEQDLRRSAGVVARGARGGQSVVTIAST